MKFPWTKTEKRESDFSDAIVTALLARANNNVPIVPSATGAFEAGAGLISRAFSSARIEGDAGPLLTASLTPSFLNMLARALVRRGEFVAYIEVMDGRVILSPCASWDVKGLHTESSWRYRVHLAGPSGQRALKDVRPESVIHVRYTSDPAQPWRGLSPLENAALTGRLSSETVGALADEASSPHGFLLPLPVDGADETVTALKADIRNLKGQLALVEGQDKMSQGTGGNARDWQAIRLGASPPESLIKLAGLASREVLGAMGVPPVLLAENPNGTAGREAWRQLLYSTVSPLGMIVAAELTRKLGAEVRLGWDELRASDIGGRARAFQSLVGGGMDITKAAALSGLMVDGE